MRGESKGARDKAAEWSRSGRGWRGRTGSAVGNHLGLKGRKEGRLVGRRAGPLMPSITQRKMPVLSIRSLLAFLIKINMFLKELTLVAWHL